jgi:hypothetical protein
MKIYINNITPKMINDKLASLKKFSIKTEQYINLYSEEGIYKISSKKNERIKEHSEQAPLKIVSPFSAIIDYTKMVSEDVDRIPNYHCASHIVEINYSINNSSNVNLIVKGFNKKNKSNDILSMMKEKSSNFIDSSTNIEEIFQTTDVYFTITPSISTLELSKYMDEFNEFFIALK